MLCARIPELAAGIGRPASDSCSFIFLYACFSVAISDPKLFGLFELSKMLRGMIVFLAAALFVRSERELRMLVVALACAVCWQGLLGLYQRYHDGVLPRQRHDRRSQQPFHVSVHDGSGVCGGYHVGFSKTAQTPLRRRLASGGLWASFSPFPGPAWPPW